ncbi:MAG: DMT family transporter [Phycisphaerales bacterium]|nr:DMT family transporter [Phycisphaerales bacterium]
MKQQAPATSMIALVLGAVGISFAAIFAKEAMHAGAGPLNSALWRLILAVPVFALLALPHLRTASRPSWWIVVPGLAFGLDLLTWHLAFTKTTAAASTLLANVSVVFVGFGGWWLLKERIDWRWGLGAGLALTAVGAMALLASPGTGAPDPLMGNLLSLGTAVCYAAYLLSAKVVRRTVHASVVMLAVVLIAPLVLAGGLLCTDEPWLPPTSDAWLWIVLLALVPQCAGQGLIIWGLRGLPASFSAIVLMIQPIGAAVWGALFLGELLTGADIALSAVVLAGILLARVGTQDTPPPAPPTPSN